MIRMRNRCAHCGDTLGLMRYTAFRRNGSPLQFCRKKCERAYYAERVADHRAAHHRLWISMKS
jgi:ribosomal protein L24E